MLELRESHLAHTSRHARKLCTELAFEGVDGIVSLLAQLIRAPVHCVGQLNGQRSVRVPTGRAAVAPRP